MARAAGAPRTGRTERTAARGERQTGGGRPGREQLIRGLLRDAVERGRRARASGLREQRGCGRRRFQAYCAQLPATTAREPPAAANASTSSLVARAHARLAGSVQYLPWVVVQARCKRWVARTSPARAAEAPEPSRSVQCHASTSTSAGGVRATACTSWPRARNAAIAARPTKPPAPVTRTRLTGGGYARAPLGASGQTGRCPRRAALCLSAVRAQLRTLLGQTAIYGLGGGAAQAIGVLTLPVFSRALTRTSTGSSRSTPQPWRC